MSSNRIAAAYAEGRWHSGDALDAKARRWRRVVLDTIGDRRILATALPASPDGVALFNALSSISQPVVLLGPDPAAWPKAALPSETPLVLPPALAPIAHTAAEQGYAPIVLSDVRTASHDESDDVMPCSSPGVVTFTSGSTGHPKPIFRSTRGLIAAADARIRTLGLRAGDGVIVGVTLVHGQGLNMLIVAMRLGGRIAFLPPINHRAALATLAMPEFAVWRATPHFADVLGRCALTAPPAAPPMCLVSSPIAKTVFDRFRDRFGVPLRQSYASGETGPIAVDTRPADDVLPGTVGTPLDDVEVHIGERLDEPAAPGETGRIWIRSPYGMVGYGFPPDVSRPGDIDGWWPTRDIGSFRDDGQLMLAGRIDDCIRSRDGRLVNLAAVADILRDLRSVRQIAVVPLAGEVGASFGAVIECDGLAETSTAALRHEMTDLLPSWARPRKVVVVPALPKLPNGKPDRLACLAVLNASV